MHRPLFANFSSSEWKPLEITKRQQLPACKLAESYALSSRLTLFYVEEPDVLTEETMLLPPSRKDLPLPVRNAGESPIRNSTSRNNRRHHSSSSNSTPKDSSNSYTARHEQRHQAHRSDERGTSSAGGIRLKQQRSRSSAPGGARDPAVENIQHNRGKPSPFPDKIVSAHSYEGISSSSSRRRRRGSGLEPRGFSTTVAATLRSSGSAVDGGLAGVGSSLRSSWSMAALPAMPTGEAVPALLSHLAGERVARARTFGWCVVDVRLYHTKSTGTLYDYSIACRCFGISAGPGWGMSVRTAPHCVER